MLCAREVILIPHHECIERSADEICWPTRRLHERLAAIAQKNEAVVKVHSHPNGFSTFSLRDDGSDRELFQSVFGWMDSNDPHASVVMLPDGELFGRGVWPGPYWEPLDLISVGGDDLKLWLPKCDDEKTATALIRNEQAFGRKTTNLLGRFAVWRRRMFGHGQPGH